MYHFAVPSATCEEFQWLHVVTCALCHPCFFYFWDADRGVLLSLLGLLCLFLMAVSVMWRFVR